MRTKDELLDSHKKITLLCYLVNNSVYELGHDMFRG